MKTRTLQIILPLLLISLFYPFAASAQSYTDKVLRFERLMREWKSANYNTGSETYAQLKSMVSEGCKMSERVAEAYIEEYHATTFDIRANAWLQYIKEKRISITLRDLREKNGDDGRRIVYCRIKYTQPGKSDREDFVGFKFDGELIFYICNDAMERANRVKADSERPKVDNKPTQQHVDNQPTQQHIDNKIVQQPTQQQPSTGITAGHEWVDLGLPSGTLWATCNVGANNPWDYGDYFAWGETTTKSTYSWKKYKYCRHGDRYKLTKYCIWSIHTKPDKKTQLERSDDAATANWGSEWCMPTHTQFQELHDNCANEWTTNYKGKGVAGRVFKSKKNGNTIFLPAAGWKELDEKKALNRVGRYSSSSIDTKWQNLVPCLYFDRDTEGFESCNERSEGYPVRPVRCKN